MIILQRYVLKELWLPFLICLAALNFIFMAGYLVKAANFIIGRGVPLFDTLYVLMLALPEMISFTVPTSILMAVLIVFGNFSQHNEIRAVKASGIHPIHLMLPAFLMGVALSLGMFIFNDHVVTNASFELRRATKRMLIKHPRALIEPGRFVRLSDSIIFLAKEQKGDEIQQIVAYEIDKNAPEGKDKPIRTIVAERGEIVSSPTHSEMQVRLYDGTVSDAQNASVQSIRFETYEFPTVGQEDIRQMKKKMRDLSLAELLVRSTAPGLSREDLLETWAAFHQRITFSLGCFIFVFMGIPIAILVHRGEIVLSFAIAMAAACVYYILFVAAKAISMQGVLPAFIIFWIPNILLCAVGAKLLKRSFVS